jgi:hypothetical protein
MQQTRQCCDATYALEAVVLDESPLQGMQLAARREASAIPGLTFQPMFKTYTLRDCA